MLSQIQIQKLAPYLTALAGIATILAGGDQPGCRKAWTTLMDVEALHYSSPLRHSQQVAVLR